MMPSYWSNLVALPEATPAPFPFHDGVYLKRIDSLTQQCRQKMYLCEGGMFKKSRDRPLKIYAHPYCRHLKIYPHPYCWHLKIYLTKFKGADGIVGLCINFKGPIPTFLKHFSQKLTVREAFTKNKR